VPGVLGGVVGPPLVGALMEAAEERAGEDEAEGGGASAANLFGDSATALGCALLTAGLMALGVGAALRRLPGMAAWRAAAGLRAAGAPQEPGGGAAHAVAGGRRWRWRRAPRAHDPAGGTTELQGLRSGAGAGAGARSRGGSPSVGRAGEEAARPEPQPFLPAALRGRLRAEAGGAQSA
jgi:hypothetical protein